ncbi:MAG: hypothetical protein AAFP90_24110, partial [Planctomycetota bacterium]
MMAVTALGCVSTWGASIAHADTTSPSSARPPSSTNQSSPSNLTAKPALSVAQKKAQALQLMARGRLALDQGNIAVANQLLQQVNALRVPQNAFTTEEPQIWQFAFDVRNAIRKSGTTQSQTGVVAKAGFNPTAGASTAAPQVAIQNPLYNPATASGGIRQVQSTDNQPTLAPPIGGPVSSPLTAPPVLTAPTCASRGPLAT